MRRAGQAEKEESILFNIVLEEQESVQLFYVL